MSSHRVHIRHVVVRQSQACRLWPMCKVPARQETVVGTTILEELDDSPIRFDGADCLTRSSRLRDVHRK
eukprot:3766919-Heterocapsa_arctica.AAC.1